MPRSNILWATHPRHLPKPPSGRVVVVDVAFAAGNQWQSKTKPFIDGLGDRLVRWIDHHEHHVAWPSYVDDPRFLLVPNQVAHACPELVTADVVARGTRGGAIDHVMAHCDFDGALSAVKWLRGGVEPWAGADEDARAIDSPGRGHALTPGGERIAFAMDEASARYERAQQLSFMTRVSWSLVDGEQDIALDDEIDTLAKGGLEAQEVGRRLAAEAGKLERADVFVVRCHEKQDNRVRRHLLMYGEERARVGALIEPEPTGGGWVTAATYDETLDLSEVAGFEGGRTDYRFARMHQGGDEQLDALAAWLATKPPPT